MPRIAICTVPGLLLALVFSLVRASAQDETVTLEPREKWTNLAADAKIDLHFTVKVPRGFKGRVAWNVRDTGSGALLGGGETDIAAEVQIPLKTPTLNPGVVRQARLTVTVVAKGNARTAATYEKTLWIFPADPFADRARWLEGLKITLFDADAKSKTAEMLKGLKVPFEEARNAAALGEFKEGLLMVGEGVSFKEEAGLAGLANSRFSILANALFGVPTSCPSWIVLFFSFQQRCAKRNPPLNRRYKGNNTRG